MRRYAFIRKLRVIVAEIFKPQLTRLVVRAPQVIACDVHCKTYL